MTNTTQAMLAQFEDWFKAARTSSGHVKLDAMTKESDWIVWQAALAAPCPPSAGRDDSRDFPFYELKFIIRVLSHEGSAPREDWAIAQGMAKRVFNAWHANSRQPLTVKVRAITMREAPVS